MSFKTKRYREAWNDIDDREWDVSLGAGGSATINAGSLLIGSGTTIGAETKVTGKKPLALGLPLEAQFGVNVSQKIANQEIYVEMVAIKRDGTIDENVVAAFKIAFADSATTTAARIETRNGGAARNGAAITVPAVASDILFEIMVDGDETWFAATALDSSASRTVSQRIQRVSPDPNSIMVPRIRVVNLGVAPASNTNVRVYHIYAVEREDNPVKISGGEGDNATGRGVATVVAGGSLSISGGTLSGNTHLLMTTNSTSLTAGATFTSSVIDNGASAQTVTSMRADVTHLAGLTPGHLVFEESIDGTTFGETCRVPIPSDGQVHTFEFPLTQRAGRFRFINGATIQTAFAFRGVGLRSSAPAWGSISSNLPFVLNTAGQAAAGVFASPTLDLGTNHQWDKVRVVVTSDQAGSFTVQQSRDGTNWRPIGGVQNVATTGPTVTEQPVVLRYLRVVHTNGATLSTALDLNLALVSL